MTENNTFKGGVQTGSLTIGNSQEPNSWEIWHQGVWALKITNEKGVEANPDVPIDELAKAVLQVVNQMMGK